MAKAKKTRAPKTETTTEKKSKRTRTDPETISKALTSYSAARASVDDAMYSINSLDETDSSEDVLRMMSKIRRSFTSIRKARSTVTAMKKNAWVRAMLTHLTEWESRVDEKWEELQSKFDDLE